MYMLAGGWMRAATTITTWTARNADLHMVA